MLEFHKEGIDVKFYSEDNDFRTADVYLIKVPDDYSFDQNINILKRITEAMLCVADEDNTKPVNLREAASSFVKTMNQLHEDSAINKPVTKTPTKKSDVTVIRQEHILKLNIL